MDTKDLKQMENDIREYTGIDNLIVVEEVTERHGNWYRVEDADGEELAAVHHTELSGFARGMKLVADLR